MANFYIAGAKTMPIRKRCITLTNTGYQFQNSEFNYELFYFL
jgi:hypothetical protein